MNNKGSAIDTIYAFSDLENIGIDRYSNDTCYIYNNIYGWIYVYGTYVSDTKFTVSVKRIDTQVVIMTVQYEGQKVPNDGTRIVTDVAYTGETPYVSAYDISTDPGILTLKITYWYSYGNQWSTMNAVLDLKTKTGGVGSYENSFILPDYLMMSNGTGTRGAIYTLYSRSNYATTYQTQAMYSIAAPICVKSGVLYFIVNDYKPQSDSYYYSAIGKITLGSASNYPTYIKTWNYTDSNYTTGKWFFAVSNSAALNLTGNYVMMLTGTGYNSGYATSYKWEYIDYTTGETLSEATCTDTSVFNGSSSAPPAISSGYTDCLRFSKYMHIMAKIDGKYYLQSGLVLNSVSTPSEYNSPYDTHPGLVSPSVSTYSPAYASASDAEYIVYSSIKGANAKYVNLKTGKTIMYIDGSAMYRSGLTKYGSFTNMKSPILISYSINSTSGSVEVGALRVGKVYKVAGI